MLRVARCGWFVLVLAAAGCARDEDYLDVYREQRAAWQEMADILATVTDEKTMAEAQATLKGRSQKYEAIAKKANALPKPPPAAVLQRLEEDRVIMRQTVERLQDEVKRVRKLDGGEEFLTQFESNSQGLLTAVQR